MSLKIRWACRKDMSIVNKVHLESDSSSELVDHLIKNTAAICSVVETNGEIVGFVFYKFQKNKSIKIYRIAVGEEHRRKGVGSFIVSTIIEKLGSANRTRIETLVSDENLAAHLFFKNIGFKATGVARSKRGDFYQFVYEKGAIGQ